MADFGSSLPELQQSFSGVGPVKRKIVMASSRSVGRCYSTRSSPRLGEHKKHPSMAEIRRFKVETYR